MPKIVSKPKVCIQAMVPERQRDLLVEEARRRDLSLSELIRHALDEVIRSKDREFSREG